MSISEFLKESKLVNQIMDDLENDRPIDYNKLAKQQAFEVIKLGRMFVAEILEEENHVLDDLENGKLIDYDKLTKQQTLQFVKLGRKYVAEILEKERQEDV